MTSSTGQAKRNTGANIPATPRPLVIQITISLSRYMRDSTDTTATNKAMVKIVGLRPSTE